jgi:H+/Cl- antiporter ClcA
VTTALRRLRAALGRVLEDQRLRVSRAEALPQLGVLGIACGLLAGLVMMAFRMVIDLSQGAFLPPGATENYEGLSPELRALLPIAGALVVAAMFQPLPELVRNVGVVHVMERLAHHQGRLPLRNAVVQFIGAAVAIVAGMSVGREGPAIHLGAASASVAGQRLGLPNNGLRILVGCGAAAAIAASFNTPLAGVAFAMEVVLMEYTVIGFAPVILAAVSATAVTHVVYGNAPAFAVPPLDLRSLWELPYVLAMGLIIGVLAAAFVALVDVTARRTAGWPFWIRALLAGVLTGACALPAPEIMGIGYDTVGSALLGNVPATVLIAVVVFKLLATGAAIGMGVPGGLIGPALVIGAAAGGALGFLGQWVAPANVSPPGFYALIGLGAMVAGTLHAPLAALTAMLELTGNPHIIWPGMLAAIAAYGVSRVVFGQQPVFITLMRARGLDYRNDPIVQSLRRVGIAAAMDLSVAGLPRRVTRAAVDAALARNPGWILVLGARGPEALLPAVDLARQTVEQPDAGAFDLLEVPAVRLQVAPIQLEATLQEAFDAMEATGAEALYVPRPSASAADPAYGIVTRADIDRHYRYVR